MADRQHQDQHPNYDRLDALFRGDVYADRLGATLDDWGGGWSRVRWTPTTGHHNFGDIVHGGAVFSAGDVAFSVASNSWGRRAVALSVDTHFLAAPDAGVELIAVGRERSRTRRTGSYQIEVSADERPVASLHCMVYRMDAWFFGEDEWPEGWRRTH